MSRIPTDEKSPGTNNDNWSFLGEPSGDVDDGGGNDVYDSYGPISPSKEWDNESCLVDRRGDVFGNDGNYVGNSYG